MIVVKIGQSPRDIAFLLIKLQQAVLLIHLASQCRYCNDERWPIGHALEPLLLWRRLAAKGKIFMCSKRLLRFNFSHMPWSLPRSSGLQSNPCQPIFSTLLLHRVLRKFELFMVRKLQWLRLCCQDKGIKPRYKLYVVISTNRNEDITSKLLL